MGLMLLDAERWHSRDSFAQINYCAIFRPSFHDCASDWYMARRNFAFVMSPRIASSFSST